jgi:hypothetical protein
MREGREARGGLRGAPGFGGMETARAPFHVLVRTWICLFVCLFFDETGMGNEGK